MADDPSMGGHLATGRYRESDPARRHRPMMVPQSQPPEAIVGRAGSSRDMWPTELCVAPNALSRASWAAGPQVG